MKWNIDLEGDDNVDLGRNLGENMTFVISSFGKGALQPDAAPDPFLPALEKSIELIYPKAKILVSCNKLKNIDKRDRINAMIEHARHNCRLLHSSPGSLKLVTHYYAWEEVTTEWVIFLDSDMLLLKPIDEFLTPDVDYIFTWRKKDMTVPGEWPWLNAGTMICRNKIAVRRFWHDYYNLMWKHAVFDRGDQFAFVELLSDFDKEIEYGKKLFELPNSTIIKFSLPMSIPSKDSKKHPDGYAVDDIKFAAVHCDYLNRTAPFLPWLERTAIQHLKGIQGTIITKTEKQDRYKRFLEVELPKLSEEERKNLKIRIDLWKKFAPKEIADGVIDL